MVPNSTTPQKAGRAGIEPASRVFQARVISIFTNDRVAYRVADG